MTPSKRMMLVPVVLIAGILLILIAPFLMAHAGWTSDSSVFRRMFKATVNFTIGCCISWLAPFALLWWCLFELGNEDDGDVL